MIGGSDDRSENNACLCKLGYNVNNDNVPSPENNPTLPDGKVTTKVEGCRYYEWNIYYLCRNICEGHRHKNLKFVDCTWSTYQIIRIGWFIIIFPYSYFQDNLILKSNGAIYGREINWDVDYYCCCGENLWQTLMFWKNNQTE